MRAKSRDLEHKEQAALIRWANMSLGKYPMLKWMFAVPNGGHRHIAVAVKLKAEGVKKGPLDLWLPFKSKGYSGLVIEMKIGNNKLTPEQEEWAEFLDSQGWSVHVCYNWNEARTAIEDYLGEVK